MKVIIFLSMITFAIPTFAQSRGEQLFTLCISCHGPQGYGNKEIGAPNIAGLPAWYIQKQLETFATGGRGQHPNDDPGNRMRPMARQMRGDDAKIIAEYVANLKPEAPEETFQGDATKGKTYFTACAACHGPAAAGNEAMHAPPLHVQNDWYLLRQLQNFKNKVRAYDPKKDPVGVAMFPMASSLPDEQAMKDVVTYIKTLK